MPSSPGLPLLVLPPAQGSRGAAAHVRRGAAGGHQQQAGGSSDQFSGVCSHALPPCAGELAHPSSCGLRWFCLLHAADPTCHLLQQPILLASTASASGRECCRCAHPAAASASMPKAHLACHCSPLPCLPSRPHWCWAKCRSWCAARWCSGSRRAAAAVRPTAAQTAHPPARRG